MILKLDTKEVMITNFYENLSENATLNASNNFLYYSERKMNGSYVVPLILTSKCT